MTVETPALAASLVPQEQVTELFSKIQLLVLKEPEMYKRLTTPEVLLETLARLRDEGWLSSPQIYSVLEEISSLGALPTARILYEVKCFFSTNLPEALTVFPLHLNFLLKVFLLQEKAKKNSLSAHEALFHKVVILLKQLEEVPEDRYKQEVKAFNEVARGLNLRGVPTKINWELYPPNSPRSTTRLFTHVATYSLYSPFKEKLFELASGDETLWEEEPRLFLTAYMLVLNATESLYAHQGLTNGEKRNYIAPQLFNMLLYEVLMAEGLRKTLAFIYDTIAYGEPLPYTVLLRYLEHREEYSTMPASWWIPLALASGEENAA